MSPLLPHRLRESSFRTYEAVIYHVVTSFPSRCDYRPKELAPITFACRLRDAMRSLYDNHWPTTVPPRFFEIYHQIVVSEPKDSPGVISVGRRDHLKAPTVRVPDPVSDTLPPLSYSTSSAEEKELLVRLAHDRMLSRPVVVSGFTIDDVKHYAARFDVIFDKHESGGYLLR